MIFDVVPFIIFDVIVPEFDIDDDVILFVCKLPLDMILPLIVWFPEHTRLFTVVILCDITAHTVLLYVLFCLTYMYCTLYHRHRYIVRIHLHFVITCSDLTHTSLSCIHIQVFT